MLTVKSVRRGSAGRYAGIRKGDVITAFGDDDALDFIDCAHADGAERLFVKALRGSVPMEFAIEKDAAAPLGLEFFEEPVTRVCRNKCVFCFVDQLPAGLRETLYLKDDDWRLSPVSGNFVTLTNLSPRDNERITSYAVSPLYVSVHATDENVRRRLLGLPATGADKHGKPSAKSAGGSESEQPGILELLKRFHDAGIKLHAQAVIVPGINDGGILRKTIRDLNGVAETLCVVPVGLTKFHKNGLPHIGRDAAAEIVALVEEEARRLEEEGKREFVFCSDEMYIRAGLPIPKLMTEAQLGNGAGIMNKFMSEFREAMNDEANADGKKQKTKGGGADLVTGVDAFPFIVTLIAEFLVRFPEKKLKLHKAVNNFFGTSVTVAGLLTGGDIIEQLSGKTISRTLLIPGSMLREGTDVFLDGTDVRTVSKKLGVKVIPVLDGVELFQRIKDT